MPKTSSGTGWASPTASLLASNNKNLKVFGTYPMKTANKPVAKKAAKKTAFNPVKYEKAKKSVFGMK